MRMAMKACGYGLVSAVLLLAGPLARADCSVSATGVAFGNYNPLSGSPADGTGTITVDCSFLLGLLLSYTIELSPGLYGSYVAREMDGGGNRLQYNLYTTSARTQVWGDGSGGTSVVQDGSLLIVFSYNKQHTVYGRIPASQLVAAGTYADTITVTLLY